MTSALRVVCDTSVLVAAILFPHSLSRRLFDDIATSHLLLASFDTARELERVLNYDRLASHLPPADRRAGLRAVIDASRFIVRLPEVKVCRDPTDDKFLSLALGGRADLIVSADDDLLVLKAFNAIPIVDVPNGLAALAQPSGE